MLKEKRREMQLWIEDSWKREKLMIKYMVKEPFLEIARLIKGSYNSMLLFWFLVFIFVLMVWKGVTKSSLNIAILLILLAYYYHFRKQQKWKQYYHEEFFEGQKLK